MIRLTKVSNVYYFSHENIDYTVEENIDKNIEAVDYTFISHDNIIVKGHRKYNPLRKEFVRQLMQTVL